eukprot:2226242-Pyramimonas_sp.AAC.1
MQSLKTQAFATHHVCNDGRNTYNLVLLICNSISDLYCATYTPSRRDPKANCHTVGTDRSQTSDQSAGERGGQIWSAEGIGGRGLTRRMRGAPTPCVHISSNLLKNKSPSMCQDTWGRAGVHTRTPAAPRMPRVCTSAAPRMPRMCTSAAPRMPPMCTSAAKRLSRVCTSAAKRMPSVCTPAAPRMPRVATPVAPRMPRVCTPAAPRMPRVCTSAAP